MAGKPALSLLFEVYLAPRTRWLVLFTRRRQKIEWKRQTGVNVLRNTRGGSVIGTSADLWVLMQAGHDLWEARLKVA